MADRFVELNVVIDQVLLHALECLKSILIVGEVFDRAHGRFLAKAIADVPEMTESAGEMPLLDVGVQILLLATADGFDEVAEVRLLTVTLGRGEFLHAFAARVEENAARIVRANDEPFAPEEDVADLGPLVAVGLEATYLEDQFGIAVVEQAELRVGRLAVVDVA